MKRKTLLVVALIMTVGVLSTSLAACGGVIFTTARLSEATMAASVDETTHQPIDRTDTFSSDTPEIFASAKLSRAPSGTEVASEWIYVSGEVADLENYTIMTLSDKYDGDQYLYFSVTKPQAGWPVGDYKVVLSVDGKEQTSIPFKVVLASPTTAPPLPETAPPSPETAPPSPETAPPSPTTAPPSPTTTEDGLATFQEISIIMPRGDSSTSVATFTNTLKKGDVIQGFIELSGEFKSQDWSFDWSAEIVNPEGKTVDIFRGNWVKKNHYDINIGVKDDGDYKIVVRHRSRYDKNLIINILPKGWS